LIAATDVPLAWLPIQLRVGSDLTFVLAAGNLGKVPLASLLAEPLQSLVKRPRLQQWL
jgi:hypothetical protein